MISLADGGAGQRQLLPSLPRASQQGLCRARPLVGAHALIKVILAAETFLQFSLHA